MTCPHCNEPLTPEEVKRLWGQFCASQVPKANRGGGAKPWKRHSDKAGKKCRCVDCIRMRELRIQQLEDQSPAPAPDEDDLTWEAVLKADPLHGYEKLIAHEASKLRAKRFNQLKAREANRKFKESIKLLRERAETEGVWDKIKEQAKARADK